MNVAVLCLNSLFFFCFTITFVRIDFASLVRFFFFSDITRCWACFVFCCDVGERRKSTLSEILSCGRACGGKSWLCVSRRKSRTTLEKRENVSEGNKKRFERGGSWEREKERAGLNKKTYTSRPCCGRLPVSIGAANCPRPFLWWRGKGFWRSLRDIMCLYYIYAATLFALLVFFSPHYIYACKN